MLNQTGIPEYQFQILQQSFWNSKDLILKYGKYK